MRIKNKKKTARIITFLLFFLIILFLIDQLGITNKLLKVNAPIKSDLLIIEGWLSPQYYNKTISVFNNNGYKKILVSGNILSKSVRLTQKGSIIVKNFIPSHEDPSIKRIALKLYGTYAKGEYSKYLIFKNDSLLSEGESIGNASIKLKCLLGASDSLVIQFTNDAIDGLYDRNLSLEKLKIGSRKINLYSEFIWIDSHNCYSCSAYYLQSKITAKELISKGIPENKIEYVISDNKKLSRTYGAAFEAVNWMKKNDFSNADIITLSFHSKRTLLSFKKVDSDLNYGIYSIDANCSKLRIIKEITGNILIRLTPKFILEWELKK